MEKVACLFASPNFLFQIFSEIQLAITPEHI